MTKAFVVQGERNITDVVLRVTQMRIEPDRGEEDRMASYVSAPVSRGSYSPPSARSVTLSPVEREMVQRVAASSKYASDLTETDWARGKLRLQRDKLENPDKYRERG